jgi:hypothetical protein
LRMDSMAERFDEAVRVTAARRGARPQLPVAQTEPRS